MFESFERSSRELVKSIVEIVYFMRGAIQYDDLMWRTPFEREIMADFIKSRFEMEAKKDFPIY